MTPKDFEEEVPMDEDDENVQDAYFVVGSIVVGLVIISLIVWRIYA